MMRCAVRRPQQCKAMIVYDGIVYGWVQVDVPGAGLLAFCPEHDEAAKHALKLAKYAADLEAARQEFWRQRRG